ncbi:hypothetical protein ACWF9G_21815 [Nocardia sp. NPDC055029]
MNTQEPPNDHFPDDARTARPHAGESIEDTRNWPGLILVALGIVLLGVTLTGAGYGFEGWAFITGTLCAICLIGGALLVFGEHRRVKARERQQTG